MTHSSSSAAAVIAPAAERAEPEAKKRRDIIDGARRVFFDKGFDGASMDEIARAGSVSKATIYVYFDSKEDLFQALVEADRRQSAERLWEIDDSDPDVASLLHRIGVSFMTMMVRPDHIRMVRMVMGVAEKFPAVGRTFFETGPCYGGRRLADLLARQTELGHLAVEDCEMAAYQFFNLCQGNIVKGLLFGGDTQPVEEKIERTVSSGVKVFLAAYGTKPAA
ncbi:TetR/AcrR family transcriptional regulator [Bosea sp. 117]|uniref:TetR/AcrR family transcriptional regulator n=1 Tax=Bosea sp. 117 TaxID=1125973 RepID=UPI00068FE0D1|nr:TetR/AcrR family transcriptional regulator [Bosea sp. 117]